MHKEITIAVGWIFASFLTLITTVSILNLQILETFRQTDYCQELPVCQTISYRAWRDCSDLAFRCHLIDFYFPWWLTAYGLSIAFIILPLRL